MLVLDTRKYMVKLRGLSQCFVELYFWLWLLCQLRQMLKMIKAKRWFMGLGYLAAVNILTFWMALVSLIPSTETVHGVKRHSVAQIV
ncbi:MAG: hypothetical protein ACI90U_000111 [Pseudomonadales bacterium]|jgi:hypothetical protein